MPPHIIVVDRTDRLASVQVIPWLSRFLRSQKSRHEASPIVLSTDNDRTRTSLRQLMIIMMKMMMMMMTHFRRLITTTLIISSVLWNAAGGEKFRLTGDDSPSGVQRQSSDKGSKSSDKSWNIFVNAIVQELVNKLQNIGTLKTWSKN